MERFMDDDMLVEHGKDTTQMWVKYEDCVQELSLTKADAQATIAALQARVQELEQWVQDQSTANLETMRHTDEMQSRAIEAESQLIQRTAELEAAKREARLQREVEAALSSKVAEYEVELNGDPQNFYGRGRTVGLRTLIAALPKVEGEITVSADPNGWYVMPLLIRCVTKEQADGIAALLQERQKLC